MMKADGWMKLTAVLSMLSSCGGAVDDSLSQNASITFVNSSDEKFPEYNFNFRNRRSYAICIPASYLSSTFGNLIIKSGNGNIPQSISDDSSVESENFGPYYIIPGNSSISMRYDMSAYKLSTKQSYNYHLFVRFVACKFLEQSATNVANHYEEAHFEGSFRKAR